ncbi:MAG: hypothetical protein V7603_1416 [Micromonosporaceae bacterium]
MAAEAELDAAAAAPALPDGVLARVRARLPEFTGALQRVAEHVLSDPAGAARATMVELAERSGTSPATVTRFCRALGFDGYAEVRLGIAAETGRAARSAGWGSAENSWVRADAVDIDREIRPSDPLDQVLHQIMAADTRAMHDTATLLDVRAIEKAAQAISTARRVDIYGASSSALVGAELRVCLHRIGLAAWSWGDIHDGLASAATLDAGDVAVGVSHTGATQETVEVLAEAGSHGATTVALTSFPGSPVAGVADVVLLTAVHATPLRPDALSARHSQLFVLDLLYVAVAQRLHDRADAAFQLTARAVDAHRAASHAESPFESRRTP